MDAVLTTHKVWNTRISTARLNRWLEGTVAHHPPPAVAGRRLKIKYITQVKTRPPGFVLSCTRPDEVPQSYVRYLVNGLRETFDIPGVPMRISIHASDNPYASKAKTRR
jgi:GTP-binding protein